MVDPADENTNKKIIYKGYRRYTKSEKHKVHQLHMAAGDEGVWKMTRKKHYTQQIYVSKQTHI